MSMGGAYKSPQSLTRQKRTARSYRSPGKKGAVLHSSGEGYARGEGANNFQYGPPAHASKSIVTLHREANRARTWPVAAPDYEAMTRDELRVVAKDKGLSGYGKLNKAGLIAAVTA